MIPRGITETLKKMIPQGLPVLLTGQPGVGKTDLVTQATEACGFDLMVSHPVVADPTDAKGLPFAVRQDGETHAEFLPFGDLRRALYADRPLAWFLDDLGQAPPAVQASYMQLILSRRINGHKLPDTVTFVAATNRREDRAGVSGILEPVKSRFAAIIDVEPDLDDWVSWALKADIRTEVIAFLRFRPALLCDFKPSMDMKQSPCPRTWAAVSRLLDTDIPGEWFPEVVQGAVGEGAAGEFIAFLRIFRSLPNIDLILLNPDTVDVPQDPATLYALCGALARKAGEQSFPQIMQYAKRMMPEFQVLLVKDSLARVPELAETREFIEWASRNSSVLV